MQLQEGANQKEALEIYAMSTLASQRSSMSQSVSHRSSMRRSASRGSSSGRRTISFSCSILGLINIQHIEERDDDGLDFKNAKQPNEEEPEQKHKRVSIRCLAYLNKPELPLLLLGALGASVHGIIFPIFGYLLSSVIRIFYEPLHLLHKDSKYWGIICVSRLG